MAVRLFLFLSVRVEHYDPLDEDEEQKQSSCRDLAPPGKKVAVEGDDRGDGGFQQHAEKGTDHIPDAAGHQGSSDDGAGDDLQLAARQSQVPSAFYIKHIGEACQYGAESVKAVNQDLGTCNRKAHQLRRLLISADGVYVPAEAGALQKDCACDDHDDEQQKIEVDVADRFDLGPFAVLIPPFNIDLESGQCIDQVIMDLDGLTAHQRADASGQEHAGQGHDERRYA